MFELAIVVLAGCVIVGITYEMVQRINERDDVDEDTARSQARLLDEIRRQQR